jgi:hypothetical protein
MLRNRVLRGVWIGLVAAAATAGALVGFGWVRGYPLQPLNTVAHILLGSRAFYVREAHPLITPVAVLAHTLSMIIWGALFSLAIGQRRGTWLWVGAVLFAIGAAAIDFLVLPARLSPGFQTVLTRGEIIVIYALLAAVVALVAGGFRSMPGGMRNENGGIAEYH